MAVDPNLLVGIANAPGLAAQSVFAGQNNALAVQAARQGMATNAFKLQAAQQDAQEAQQYQTDVTAFLSNPSPAALMGLTAKYPKQADALKKGWDVKDHAQRASDMGQYGAIYAALDNGRTDLALSQLRSRRDAEKAKSVDTSELDHYIDAIAAGNANAIKAVKGYALSQIAAGDSDKFSEIYKTVGGDRGTKVVAAGGALVDETGRELYKAPFAPRPVTVGEGDTVVEYQPGGGDPASGGGGRYTGGWTPRARNGGDNDDAAVDGKIAGAAQALGIGPDDSLSGKSPMDIARAMTLSEGGAGSLADRNNNPANLRNSDGSFKKFATKEAGIRAAAALVARKMRNGQTTVRSMIEGLPVSGGAQSGPRVIAQGQPKAGYALLTPEENQQAGLDPNVRYQRSPDGQITALGGQSKAQLRPIPTAGVKAIQENRGTIRQIDAALAELERRPKSIGPGTGALGDTFTQYHDPDGTTTRAAIGKIGGQIIHDVSGAAVTLSEEPRFKPYVPTVTDRPEVAKAKLRQLRALATGVLGDLTDYYSEAQGYRAYEQQGGSSPVRVRTLQQAQKLAPGTLYIAPDGKTRRR